MISTMLQRRREIPFRHAAAALAAAIVCAAGASAQAAPATQGAGGMLTLEQAVEMALASNRAYGIARLDEKAAANRATWGRAGLLPKVDATAAWSRSVNDTRQERVQGAATTVETRDAASAGIGATWTVFEGFSSLAAHARLEAQARLASLQGEEARQGVAAGVILAYGEAVRHKRILSALDSSMAFSRERVRLTEGKYGLGSVSKLELLQARLDLNADSSARLRQELALEAAKRDLNHLLAMPEGTGFDVADSVPLSALPPRAALADRALEQNPAYLQAEVSRRIASLGVREYVGGLFPKLGLSAGYNYSENSSEAGFLRSNEQLGWTYGANLRFNLFDGGNVSADLRNARLAVRRADLQVADARSRVESALAEAWNAHEASLRVLALEASNLELARENVAIALERLRLGTIVSLELREAQEKFLEAQTRLVSARFETKRAETELLRLAGLLGKQGKDNFDLTDPQRNAKD
jgi:outer membrane protein TolC